MGIRVRRRRGTQEPAHRALADCDALRGRHRSHVAASVRSKRPGRGRRLASRGMSVPEFAPVEYQPWRRPRTVYVSKKELQPILDLLSKKHPPGSEWKWGFNWVGKPRRGRISAEEGIDLDAIVAEAASQTTA